MRRRIVAGNWKMHKTRAETSEYLAEFIGLLGGRTDADVVICPPYTALSTVRDLLEGTGIEVGAQNVFWKSSGAYTGRISPPMLAELGVAYVIVGHSESRGRFGVPEPDFDAEILQHFGDTDASVNRKARAARAAGITPIICVGETYGERHAGQTDEKVTEQIEKALLGFTAEESATLVFAYEPVWAIGTGDTCDSTEANRVCGLIRTTIANARGRDASDLARIQYGGSVKPENARELFGQPEIDGALVGGASLKPADFAAIVRACAPE